tara:strand:- start:11613 stop:12218 length:606 start_codon:yes stop_codon:yes gene_type:complete
MGILTSAETGNLATAKAAAQLEMKHAKADSQGYHGNRFANITRVHEAVVPALAKHAIAVTQSFDFEGDGIVRVDTVLTHESGEWERSSCRLPAEANTIWGTASAISYARRYALALMAGAVPSNASDEDNDGRTASPKSERRDDPDELPPAPDTYDTWRTTCEKATTRQELLTAWKAGPKENRTHYTVIRADWKDKLKATLT